MRQKVSTTSSSAAVRIAHDAQNPTVDGALMEPEERLKCVHIALPEQNTIGIGACSGALTSTCDPSPIRIALSTCAYARGRIKVTRTDDPSVMLCKFGCNAPDAQGNEAKNARQSLT